MIALKPLIAPRRRSGAICWIRVPTIIRHKLMAAKASTSSTKPTASGGAAVNAISPAQVPIVGQGQGAHGMAGRAHQGDAPA
jgi:hypothetical protein